MGELQWALLIVCVVMVLALYVLSRRGKSDRNTDDANPPGAPDPSGDQMDLLSPPRAGVYDEFGVGPKRKRGEGVAGGADTPVREPSAPSMATLLRPLPGQTPVAPRFNLDPPPRQTPSAPIPTPPPVEASKLVALIVAPTEETDILGPQLHAALAALGLRFGEGEVYHRSIGGRIVYSVASLLKPGKLVPADAASFSTKGLTLVLNLPGPVEAGVALDDMLAAARSLATALKAEIFDARRQRLSDELSAALRAEVQDWARAQKPA